MKKRLTSILYVLCYLIYITMWILFIKFIYIINPILFELYDSVIYYYTLGKHDLMLFLGLALLIATPIITYVLFPFFYLFGFISEMISKFYCYCKSLIEKKGDGK